MHASTRSGIVPKYWSSSSWPFGGLAPLTLHAPELLGVAVSFFAALSAAVRDDALTHYEPLQLEYALPLASTSCT